MPIESSFLETRTTLLSISYIFVLNLFRIDFFMTILDDIWTTRAKQELGETSAVLNLALTRFKQELASSLSCNIIFQDDFLIRFLRARKFDVKKACVLFEKYRQMKQRSSSLFRVSPVTDIQFILEMDIQTVLPLDDNFGRQIYIYRVGKEIIKL